ncbi:MAG: MFS transporter [Candidatus Thorarchaeota archaeon]
MTLANKEHETSLFTNESNTSSSSAHTQSQDSGVLEKDPHMRSFLKIFVGQSFSLMGSALVQFSLVWWLTASTGSAIVLVIASLMAMLPQIILSPFIGPLIDRWNRKKVMMASDMITASAIIALAILWSQNATGLIHVYILMAIRSAMASFQWPALQASASLMVPKEHLSRVNGMYQALTGLSKIAAPPLGALLLAFIPIELVLLIDVATAAIAIIPLLSVQVPQHFNDKDGSNQFSNLLSDVMTGVRFMKEWLAGRYITAALMLTNFILVPTFSLLPLLVLLHFNGTIIELAWVESLMGIGMVLGGISLGIWGGFRRRMLTTAIALVSAAVGIFVVGITPPSLLPLALCGIFIAGFMIPIASGSLMALVQAVVPSVLQGRVFTVLMSLGPAMAPVGLLSAGFIVEVLGIQSWFIVSSIVLILIAIVGALTPAILNAGEIEE